jgi:hypothetical protein
MKRVLKEAMKTEAQEELREPKKQEADLKSRVVLSRRAHRERSGSSKLGLAAPASPGKAARGRPCNPRRTGGDPSGTFRR